MFSRNPTHRLTYYTLGGASFGSVVARVLIEFNEPDESVPGAALVWPLRDQIDGSGLMGLFLIFGIALIPAFAFALVFSVLNNVVMRTTKDARFLIVAAALIGGAVTRAFTVILSLGEGERWPFVVGGTVSAAAVAMLWPPTRITTPSNNSLERSRKP